MAGDSLQQSSMQKDTQAPDAQTTDGQALDTPAPTAQSPEKPILKKARRLTYYLAALGVAFVLELVLFNLGFWQNFLKGGEELGPFEIVPLRLLILTACCYYAFLFRPTAPMHKTPLRATRTQLIIIAVAIGLHAASFVLITQHVDEEQFFQPGTTKFDGAVYDDGQQYAYLADSFLAGRTWLDLEVPDWLASMDNPYNAEERFQHAYETGEPCYWDFAFYKGKYYCYFGPLPALVAFVPFKALTGHDLRTDYAVALFSVILCLSIAVFLFAFLRRFMPKATLGVYLLSFIFFVLATQVLSHVFYPLFYSLPPLAACSCIFFGLAAWLRAKKPDGSLRCGLLLLGSFLISLTLLCRPQMFVSILLAFPLFWTEITRKRLFFSKGSWLNTSVMILPCLLVGLAAMAYNAARFGSPFDFGATYNLTGFDMTQKAYSIDPKAMAMAVIFYVLMPLDIKLQFPYLDEINWRSSIPVEPFYGGFFAFNPAALALLGLWHFRRALKLRKLLGLSVLCCMLALLLMMLSTQVASISMRYFSDFAWAFAIAALCVWLVWLERDGAFDVEKRAKNTYAKTSSALLLFVVLVLVGEGLSYWNLLSVGRYGELITMNPDFYGFVAALFS